jgi:2-keto-4-pentenoate hydratase
MMNTTKSTTISFEEKQKIALTLYNAHKQNNRLQHLDKSIGYEIQHLVIDKKIKEDNEQVKGYKISLTSEETQRWFNSDSPVYGTLTTTSISDGVIRLDDLSEPLIETELMFIITEDLSFGADEEEILRKSMVAPGLEIPDSRFINWFPKLSLGEIVADNSVAGRIVVGETVDELSAIDWENIKVCLFLDDEKLDEGYSSSVLGNPIHAVSWLSHELALQGKRLTKGMVVSSGTFILPKPLRKGMYKAVFDTLGEIMLMVK